MCMRKLVYVIFGVLAFFLLNRCKGQSASCTPSTLPVSGSWQSSTYEGSLVQRFIVRLLGYQSAFSANNGVDAKTPSGDISGTCAQTQNELYPWWQAQLDDRYHVTSVVMTPPQYCDTCPADFTLENILVEVGELSVEYDSTEWNSEWNAGKQNCSFMSIGNENLSVVVNCSTPLFGNFVRLSKLNTEETTLPLCEVEILGYLNCSYSDRDLSATAAIVSTASTNTAVLVSSKSAGELHTSNTAHSRTASKSVSILPSLSSMFYSTFSPALDTLDSSQSPTLVGINTSVSFSESVESTASASMSLSEHLDGTPTSVVSLSGSLGSTPTSTVSLSASVQSITASSMSFSESASADSTAVSPMTAVLSYSINPCTSLSSTVPLTSFLKKEIPSVSQTFSAQSTLQKYFTTQLQETSTQSPSVSLSSTASVTTGTSTPALVSWISSRYARPSTMSDSFTPSSSIREYLEAGVISSTKQVTSSVYSSQTLLTASYMTASGTAETSRGTASSLYSKLHSNLYTSSATLTTWMTDVKTEILRLSSSSILHAIVPTKSLQLSSSSHVYIPSNLLRPSFTSGSTASLKTSSLGTTLRIHPSPSTYHASTSSSLSSTYHASTSSSLSSTYHSSSLSSTYHASTSPPLFSTYHASTSSPLFSTYHASTSSQFSSTYHVSTSSPLSSTYHASTSSPLSSTYHASTSSPLSSTYHASTSSPLSSTYHASTSSSLSVSSSMPAASLYSTVIPVWCPCTCNQAQLIESLTSNNKTTEQVAEEIEEALIEQKVDIKATAINERKLVSADDKRDSATVVGTVGVVFCTTLVLLVIVSDLPRLIAAVKRVLRQQLS